MSERPSVLVLSFSRIASDARVLKQVRLLAERYAVTTCGYGPAPEGVAEHVEVPEDRQAWVKDPRWLMLRRYRRVYAANLAVSWTRDRLPVGAYDVVVANDIEAVPLALELRPRGGVHADLHEYAPGQNTELRRWRWFVAPYLRWLVRTSVPRADSVTTVGPVLARRYAAELGIEVGVVVNATPLASLAPRATSAPIRLVHSGIAQRNRSLEITIDAVEASTSDVRLDLYLVPNDPAYTRELEERAAGSARVRVLPPVPYDELVTTLHDYDVGVFVLPPVNANYAAALPNKLFDFVQARLGVVVGPSPEMASVVREHALGVVTEDFTVASLTAALDALTTERVDSWRHAADHAANELSAEVQSRPWLDAVDRLSARAR
ncbi:glycosyltransferase [Cellulosimicrobium cellulans]|uniref:glycosyltransferase n=1 Tax=Cellulosimicrobium cellulans TaxID=1710 RepID=UPI0008494452|nr:glycosyltransferase [Cellulosimicrobium cellulans]